MWCHILVPHLFIFSLSAFLYHDLWHHLLLKTNSHLWGEFWCTLFCRQISPLSESVPWYKARHHCISCFGLDPAHRSWIRIYLGWFKLVWTGLKSVLLEWSSQDLDKSLSHLTKAHRSWVRVCLVWLKFTEQGYILLLVWEMLTEPNVRICLLRLKLTWRRLCPVWFDWNSREFGQNLFLVWSSHYEG